MLPPEILLYYQITPIYASENFSSLQRQTKGTQKQTASHFLTHRQKALKSIAEYFASTILSTTAA